MREAEVAAEVRVAEREAAAPALEVDRSRTPCIHNLSIQAGVVNNSRFLLLVRSTTPVTMLRGTPPT